MLILILIQMLTPYLVGADHARGEHEAVRERADADGVARGES